MVKTQMANRWTFFWLSQLVKMIMIDEIGYLPFDELGAHCFFQLISRRYEKASIIFTSNKSYRVLHHCTTINIKGDSYRIKERKRQGLIPQNFSR
jgi:DNA replication protein DnaC